jgi:hypothetical protein
MLRVKNFANDKNQNVKLLYTKQIKIYGVQLWDVWLLRTYKKQHATKIENFVKSWNYYISFRKIKTYTATSTLWYNM